MLKRTGLQGLCTNSLLFIIHSRSHFPHFDLGSFVLNDSSNEDQSIDETNTVRWIEEELDQDEKVDSESLQC